MTKKQRALPAMFLCVVLIAGCGTVDLTKDYTGPPPTCEIHGCPMQRELIHVGGEIIYLPDYFLKFGQFPHHGGHRYIGEGESPRFSREVIDFVCPECDWAYFLYWKEWRKAQAESKRER